MSVRTGFVQRRLGTAIKLSVTNDDGSKGEVSQFGALAISLAATVGTGNIVGVGTAIASGGPGAVFYCLLQSCLDNNLWNNNLDAVDHDMEC